MLLNCDLRPAMDRSVEQNWRPLRDMESWRWILQARRATNTRSLSQTIMSVHRGASAYALAR